MTHSRKERTGQTGCGPDYANPPTLESRIESLEEQVGALTALLATVYVDFYAHINEGEGESSEQ